MSCLVTPRVISRKSFLTFKIQMLIIAIQTKKIENNIETAELLSNIFVLFLFYACW